MADISKTEWLKNAMAKMGWTADEAEAVWNSDREIDKGKKQDFDLSKEQLKVAQKFAKTGTSRPPPHTNSPQESARQIPRKRPLLLNWQDF